MQNSLLYYGLGILLLSLLGLAGCTPEPPPTPEEVVRQYVTLLGQGRTDDAKALCTPAGQAFLVALEAVMSASETRPDSSLVDIRSIQCSPLKIAASTMGTRCITTEFDGFEEYRAEYRLVQLPEGWRIDADPEKGKTSSGEEVLQPSQNIVTETVDQ